MVRKCFVSFAVAASGLLAVACGGGGRSGVLPPKPTIIDVRMRENVFDYNPVIPSGRVVFRAVNVGSEAHRLTLLPLAADLPPIDQQLHGDTRSPTAPFAGTLALRPGDTSSFAVDLAPGVRYALICFLVNPEGQSHALLGMNSEFRTPDR